MQFFSKQFLLVLLFFSLRQGLPSGFWSSLPRAGPQYWLYWDDATMAESGMLRSFIPRGDIQFTLGISNPVHGKNMYTGMKYFSVKYQLKHKNPCFSRVYTYNQFCENDDLAPWETKFIIPLGTSH